jgi:rhamnosyltransferase subunit B
MEGKASGMPHLLIATFGSYGDLYPYLAIGAELQRRGLGVTIATSSSYRTLVEGAGLVFHAVRPDVDLHDRAKIQSFMDARRGSERIIRFLTGLARENYEDTLDAARDADAIVTHPITFGAVLAAQKLRLPWISTVLAPMSMFSAHDPPVMPNAPGMVHVLRLGSGIANWFWKLGQKRTRPWVRPVLDLQKELDLPPLGHPLFEGQHSPSLVVALFSRYMAAPQPDWPAQTVVTGFPFYDHGELALDHPVFDSAPVVFTLGSSAVGAAGSFYQESLAAIGTIRRTAVFLTGPYPQGLPAEMPPGVTALPYAPHGAIFPRASIIVHQGGIGTAAQALRAGRPMLVLPFGHDQFDNAARLRRLGVAEVLYRSQYKASRVAKVLRQLLEEKHYAEFAKKLGEQVRAEDGVRAAADAIEVRVVEMCS